MKTNRKKTERIVIDPVACKGCHLCIDQCPKNVYAVSEDRNAKGYLLPTAARLEDCIACLLCEMICPDLAITVEVEDHAK